MMDIDNSRVPANCGNCGNYDREKGEFTKACGVCRVMSGGASVPAELPSPTNAEEMAIDVRKKLVELLNNSFAEQYKKRGLLTAPHTATDLVANGVTVQEWISVKDRLPKDGQSVLTCKNGVYDIQTYEERRNGWLYKGWFWSMATVTHWMPLPEPPKGE